MKLTKIGSLEGTLGKGFVAVGSTNYRKTILEFRTRGNQHGVEIQIQSSEIEDRGKGERSFTRLICQLLDPESALEIADLLTEAAHNAGSVSRVKLGVGST